MAIRRRDALLFAGVGIAAAGAGLVVGPMVLQSQSGAADLLAAEFVDLSGQRRRLIDWRGRALVCNFWATWCPPCVEEMPLLARARKKYASKSVEFAGIALDSADKVKAFVGRLGIDYPILIGDAGTIELMKKLGNRSGGLPFTVFLDRKGALTHTKLGAITEGELDSLVRGLIDPDAAGRGQGQGAAPGGDLSY